MKSLDLSLRQKRILHIMQHNDTYITSAALAAKLNVSSRTIRNDVVKINEELAPYNARILSLKSRGYGFESEDPKLIESLNQIETAFFSKENRARYLAFKLCFAEEPQNLYDLEDEMYISHTTLDHALRDIASQFSDHTPYIRLIRQKDTVRFEDDEMKKRLVLVEMLRKSWNYHARRNAYYDDNFIEPKVLDFIIDLVSSNLNKYNILLEDPSIVFLNLMIAVMYYRIRDGHVLPYEPPIPKADTSVYYACQDILNTLTDHLHCYIHPEELDRLYLFITANRLLDQTTLTRETAKDYFGPNTRLIAEHFLTMIQNYFRLDFSDDDDFYITLLQYIRTLQRRSDIYNEQYTSDFVKNDLRIELIIAHLFQPLALQYLGKTLTETQLIYLAYCLCGALENFVHNHPGDKLNTVICCQMNMPFLFAMKRRLESDFGNYLNITALLPVNIKNSFDFTDTDLILTTVQKPITRNPTTDTLYMSINMTEDDLSRLEHLILQRTIRKIYTASPSPHDLFINAFRHEKTGHGDPYSIFRDMAADFINAGFVTSDFLNDIIQHEENSTYAICPGVAYIYSLIPAEKSAMSILTLDHRITWNTHKIRVFIMTCFTLEDMPITFRLANLFYDEAYDLPKIKMEENPDVLTRYYLSFIDEPLTP